MTKRAKDKPIYAFVRRGNYLIPEMEYDAQALDGVRQGQRVHVEIKQWRNKDRLRAYWATLQECIDATGCAPSKESLDAYVRPEVGFVEGIRLASGHIVGVPRPINTRECDEPEMIRFFQAAEELLASKFGFVSERKTHEPDHQSSGGSDDAAAGSLPETSQSAAAGNRYARIKGAA